MHLIKNNLGLYFCTALFCHIAVLSAVYNWSDKNSAGTQQATSVITYFALSTNTYSNVARAQSACSVAEPGSYHSNMQQSPGSASLLPGYRKTVSQYSTTLLKNNSMTRKENSISEPNLHTSEHHGYSKLLAVLHSQIQEKQTYPLEAVTSQQSGTAIVNFTLLPNGNIVNSTLHQSSGYSDLDQAALTAVQAISPFKSIAVNARQNFDVAVSFALS